MLAYLTPLLPSYSLFTSFKVYDGADASVRRLDLISAGDPGGGEMASHLLSAALGLVTGGSRGKDSGGLRLGPWESIKE